MLRFLQQRAQIPPSQLSVCVCVYLFLAHSLAAPIMSLELCMNAAIIGLSRLINKKT